MMLQVQQNTCLMSSFVLFPRKPFPIGDRVTFCGKKCVCQQCSHSLVSSEPVKIHGPSRKSPYQNNLLVVQGLSWTYTISVIQHSNGPIGQGFSTPHLSVESLYPDDDLVNF